MQATWSPEKRALATNRLRETIARLPADVKLASNEKRRTANIKTWSVLPERFVKATLENPAWHEKIRITPKVCADPEARVRKIVETKVGMSYDRWLQVKDEFEVYAMQVRHHTLQQPLETLPNYDARGYRTYHLDHKYAVAQGFRDRVPPEVIGHIVNLQYVTMKENLSKGDDCSLTLDELWANYLAATAG